ncbi:FABP family protein [Dactylosporangium aurantiacum]|uniref:Peroxynitrite isomerase n=1 Tax=Dactylosporangium aurantiacum TaxID=35754 RepID=A0A9Q9IKY7_9ACTN|nr:FABP family protein [Dactylosporangium aurantiacum]MDG6100652.1 FABP family protein [Dactylosporangium aurantiacum]UWZ55264.1 FABP family protein [Dactylosporangium aurantiacum]
MTDVQPPWAGLAQVGEYPYEETHDLRVGPDLHPALLGLLPLVGVWRGRGQGDYPTIEGFHYAQEIRFSHDGRPFLFYESRAWVIDVDGNPIKPSNRETGWWRPVLQDGKATDEVEVLLNQPTGIMELYIGQAKGTTQWQMATDAVVRTSTAKEVRGAQRLYGIVDGALLYAFDLAAVGQQLQPHLSARLERVAG